VVQRSPPPQPDAPTFTSAGTKAPGSAHGGSPPPGCRSDVAEEELDQIGLFAKAYAEALEILLPVPAVACLGLYLLCRVYSSV